MKRILLCAGLAAASGLAAPAGAAAAPAEPSASQLRVDPATLEAADRLLSAMGYERMMRRTSDALVAQMGPMFRKAIQDETGKTPDDALIDRLTAIQSDFLSSTLVNSPDVRRAIATLYASRFTVPELNHLAELYRDPVMRKWTEVSPEMTAQLVPLIQGVADAHREELQRKIITAVTDYYASRDPGPES